MNPLVKNVTLKCQIKRDKSGINRLYPKYYMYMSNGLKYLMAGKKAAFNKTSNYVVSMHRKDFSKDLPSYLGKVRSNFLGTEFTLYDNGVNPKKVKGS